MSLPTIHPTSPLLVKPEPLTPAAFAPFGTVITAPLSPTVTSFPSTIPDAQYPAYQPRPVPANQSTALKTSPISPLVNNYPGGDGNVIRGGHGHGHVNTAGGKGLMSIFSSFPRRNVYLRGGGSGDSQAATPRLKLGILERHPYTTQTFCPFNYSAAHDNNQPSSSSTSTPQSTPKTYILIIVAPTLPTLPDQTAVPTNPPDLARLRAFIHPLNSDTPNAAVTYNAGTWHAPMIVLGSRRVDFLVTQFANGVALDDCQEVLVGGGPDEAVLRGSVRRERKMGRGGKGQSGVEVEVEVDLEGWGVEVEEVEDVVDGEERSEEREKWTTDEMIYRAVRASKL